MLGSSPPQRPPLDPTEADKHNESSKTDEEDNCNCGAASNDHPDGLDEGRSPDGNSVFEKEDMRWLIQMLVLVETTVPSSMEVRVAYIVLVVLVFFYTSRGEDEKTSRGEDEKTSRGEDEKNPG